MIRRERVNGPDELRPGDRVEMVDELDATHVAVIDVLWLHGVAVWCGIVVSVTPGSFDADQQPMRAGELGCIGPDAYPAGCVFIRRRSREDRSAERSREASRV